MTQQTNPQLDQSISNDKAIVIPVIEEQLHIDKVVVETGKVKISKKVHEREEEVNISLTHEDVNIERVEINQYIQTPPPGVRYEGDKMIIPVIKEVLVVEKRLLLVEEIHVTRRIIETTETQHVTLRNEEVLVDRIQTSGATTSPVSK